MVLSSTARAPVAAALGAVLAACGGEPAPASRPPDIVLIAIDTLRADYLSLYGHDRPTSPRLDAWAAGGTVFERHWSASSWTSPAMAMLFTGVVRSDNSGRLWEDQPNLVDVLGDAGYYTAGVASNALLSAGRGWGRGFDHYEVWTVPERGPRNGWPAREVVDRGLAALDAAPADRPTFLFLMPFDPHQPYMPASREGFDARLSAPRKRAFLRALGPERYDLLDERTYRTLEEAIASYEAEVAQVDAALGFLFDALEARGRLDETLVVVTADHGEGLWQRAAPPDSVDKQKGPFPLLYSTHGAMLEPEQVHVPLVLRGPGVPAGERRDEPTSSIDVMPTILSLAGLERPPTDGVDLFAPGALEDRDELVAFISRGGSILVDGRWQLIVPTPHRAEKYGLEPVLYDLANDPRAEQPVDDPELAAELAARLQAWWDSRRIREDMLDDDERAVLEALGYTDGEADPGR